MDLHCPPLLAAVLLLACRTTPAPTTSPWSGPTATSDPSTPLRPGRGLPPDPVAAAAPSVAPALAPPFALYPTFPPPGPVPKYDRRAWRHWIDADRDCQNTRQEVLIAESEVPVTFADEHRCKVSRGRWTCPYTGRVFTDPRRLDVDHLVPLENAHASGGWWWDAQTKEAYANDLRDPEHLVAVDRGANRAKGAQGPQAWMPPNRAYRCEYVRSWQAIKKRWGLTMDEAEAAFVASEVAACGGP